MDTIAAMWPIVLVIAAVLLVVWGVLTYNRLVRTRNRAENAWSQVDVQLRRRYDVVPNFVETVRGYADHEQSTLEAVVRARNEAMEADTITGQASSENALTQALRRLFALSEAYPELRASDNFRMLQLELSDTEGDIAIARQIFNDAALTYNNAVETIPSRFVAGLAGFDAMAFFQAEDEGRSVPKVEF